MNVGMLILSYKFSLSIPKVLKTHSLIRRLENIYGVVQT